MLPVVFTESPHQQATSSLSRYINHLQNGFLWLLVLPHGDNFLQVCLEPQPRDPIWICKALLGGHMTTQNALCVAICA